MGKQLIAPKSQVQSEDLIRIDQKNFGKMFNDIPASEIGDNLSLNRNMKLSPQFSEGRTGSRRWSSTILPALRTGFTASRVGDLVTLTAGTVQFTDVYNKYFVWPDGNNDEIIEVITTTTFKTRQTGDRESTSGCTLRSRVFGCFYHRALRKVIIHIDSRFFFADYRIREYFEIYGLSNELPAQVKTFFYEEDEYVYAINANGVFKIAINERDPYFYKTNSPVPTQRITNIIKTERRTFGRRYIYSNGRLVNGSYNGTRTGVDGDSNVPFLLIEQESGTTLWNEDANDYGEVFTERQIGLGNETYGVLECDTAGIGINSDLDDWRDVDIFSFGIEMNSEGVQQCSGDMANIQTLDDVRFIIEASIRVYWPDATVEIETISTGDSRFIITTGQINGSTVSYLTAGTSGTDISNLDIATGCGILGVDGVSELDNSVSYTEPSVIGSMAPGSVRDYSPTTPQYHWTHYCVHGTKESGATGIDPVTGKGNNPEIFIHIDDIPVMKAFTAVATNAGSPDTFVTASIGIFHQHDVGDTVRFENGTTGIIDYLCDIDRNRVYDITSQYCIITGGTAASQSAVIGSVTVLTVSKTGNTITRVSGNRAFTATDVRKPIFLADGTIEWIIAFVDGDTVTVKDSGADKPSQGAAIDPTTRTFNDITTELQISSRLKNFLTDHRFFNALPEVDLGVIVPGFIAVCENRASTIYYSPLATAKKYLGGYYNAAFQYDNGIEDEITFLLKLPDKLAVICSKSTWITSTNSPRSTNVPGVGISVALLPGFTLIDNVGCVHIGSIRKIGIGLYTIITSEPAHRLFDGFKFSDNLAEDQVMELLKKMSTFSVSMYNDIDGLKIWGARED